MNIQLFIIIALVSSSLLTLTDRASAKDLNKQRYLQTNVEQFCCEDSAPDQDNETVDGNIYSSLPVIRLAVSSKDLSSAYTTPQHRLLINKLHPRAPPVFLMSFI